MDDLDLVQAIRGQHEKEKRFFEGLRFWLAWHLCHIYNQNPYLQKGKTVKIEDLIKVEETPVEDEKEAREEALKRMEEVFARRDAAKARAKAKKEKLNG